MRGDCIDGATRSAVLTGAGIVGLAPACSRLTAAGLTGTLPAAAPRRPRAAAAVPAHHAPDTGAASSRIP